MSVMGENLVAENGDPTALIRNYLMEHEPIFARLYTVREKACLPEL